MTKPTPATPKGPTMSRVEWKAVLRRDPCVYCGGKAKDVDHIHPRNYGGSEGWPNLAPTCKACNQMKADGTLMWMLWRLHEKRNGRYKRRVIGYRLTPTGRVPIRSLLEYQGMLRKPEQQIVAGVPVEVS